jgi:hypothetical protein
MPATLLCLFVEPVFQCDLHVEFSFTDVTQMALCVLYQFAQCAYI